jgi:hypothetical protein
MVKQVQGQGMASNRAQHTRLSLGPSDCPDVFF